MNTNFYRREAATAARGEKTLRRRRTPGKALALAVLLCLCIPLLMAPSCDNWELNAYRTLAAANVAYERSFATLVVLHETGKLSDATYSRARDVATRVSTMLRSGAGLMSQYAELRSQQTKLDVQSILLLLPRFLSELVALVDAAGGGPGPAFELELQAALVPLERELDRLDELRATAHEEKTR